MPWRGSGQARGIPTLPLFSTGRVLMEHASHEHSHSHGTLRRIRKKRRHKRKLSENRELFASVILMIVAGLALVGLITYLLSTQSCSAPRMLK